MRTLSPKAWGLVAATMTALCALGVLGCTGTEGAPPRVRLPHPPTVDPAETPSAHATVTRDAPSCDDWPYPPALRVELADRGRRFVAGLSAGTPTDALRRELSPGGIELLNRSIGDLVVDAQGEPTDDSGGFSARHLSNDAFDAFVRGHPYADRFAGLEGFEGRFTQVITRWRVPRGADDFVRCTAYEEQLSAEELAQYFDGAVSVIVHYDEHDCERGKCDFSLPIVVFRPDSAGDFHVTALFTTELAI